MLNGFISEGEFYLRRVRTGTSVRGIYISERHTMRCISHRPSPSTPYVNTRIRLCLFVDSRVLSTFTRIKGSQLIVVLYVYLEFIVLVSVSFIWSSILFPTPNLNRTRNRSDLYLFRELSSHPINRHNPFRSLIFELTQPTLAEG